MRGDHLSQATDSAPLCSGKGKDFSLCVWTGDSILFQSPIHFPCRFVSDKVDCMTFGWRWVFLIRPIHTLKKVLEVEKNWHLLVTFVNGGHKCHRGKNTFFLTSIHFNLIVIFLVWSAHVTKNCHQFSFVAGDKSGKMWMDRTADVLSVQSSDFFAGWTEPSNSIVFWHWFLFFLCYWFLFTDAFGLCNLLFSNSKIKCTRKMFWQIEEQP